MPNFEYKLLKLKTEMFFFSQTNTAYVRVIHSVPRATDRTVNKSSHVMIPSSVIVLSILRHLVTVNHRNIMTKLTKHWHRNNLRTTPIDWENYKPSMRIITDLFTSRCRNTRASGKKNLKLFYSRKKSLKNLSIYFSYSNMTIITGVS